jgi:hypothetical protein
MARIELQRVYGEGGDARGQRFLVDRLWPRGNNAVVLKGYLERKIRTRAAARRPRASGRPPAPRARSTRRAATRA